MQKDGKVIFVCRCFKTRICAKRWFPKDGFRRVTIKAMQKIKALISLEVQLIYAFVVLTGRKHGSFKKSFFHPLSLYFYVLRYR